MLQIMIRDDVVRTVFSASVAVIAFLSAAAANAAEPPRLSVTGVAHNDVLNLRAQPGARSPRVASLPSNAADLAVVAQATRSLDWVMVEKGPARGWANARFLAYGDPRDGALPVRLRCSGTEPFWGVEVGYGRANADLAFEQRRTRLALATPIQAAARPHLWLLPSANARDPASFLLVERRVCSDGMSERSYPFTVSLRIAGTLLAGCCS
jgi:uncharacterized membrane protein